MDTVHIRGSGALLQLIGVSRRLSEPSAQHHLPHGHVIASRRKGVLALFGSVSQAPARRIGMTIVASSCITRHNKAGNQVAMGGHPSALGHQQTRSHHRREHAGERAAWWSVGAVSHGCLFELRCGFAFEVDKTSSQWKEYYEGRWVTVSASCVFQELL